MATYIKTDKAQVRNISKNRLNISSSIFFMFVQNPNMKMTSTDIMNNFKNDGITPNKQTVYNSLASLSGNVKNIVKSKRRDELIRSYNKKTKRYEYRLNPNGTWRGKPTAMQSVTYHNINSAEFIL